MKKNYFIGVFLFFGILTANAQLGTDVFTLGADDASNYASNSWVTTMAGSGFGNWTFDTATPNGGFAGRYIGSFSTDLDVSSDSFALFANSGNDAASGASTSFPKTLEEGDVFTISVGVNFRDGNKGFDLRNSSNGTVVNFNVGSDKYTIDGTDLYSDVYDSNTVITFTFTQNASTLSWVADRTGGRTESASGSVSGVSAGTITNIRFYNVSAGTNGDGGSGERNLFLNSLSFTSKYNIPNGSSTTVTSNTEIPYLTVESGGTVTINSGNGLNVTGNLTNSGTITAINGASLGVDGTATGDITYKRSVSTTNWYLMASPVVGETAVDFLNNSGNIGTNESGDFAIGTYGYDDGWTYNYSNTFESGKGYAVHKSIAGDLVFTGTFQSADVAVAVIDTNVGGLLDYNVFGNPYLSFVAVNSSADATNNILTVNTNAGQDELATAQIWLWDQGDNDYDIINHASPAFFLAPGQGFIVQGKGGFGDAFFDFTEAMTSHVNSDSFQKSAVKKTSRPEIKLFINDGTASKHTDIYYINGTTTGFDNGYDGTIFGGASVSFKVFTGLVSDSQGEKLGIQSLPDSGYENMTIPVGVIAEANTEITFTANTTNIPSGLKVFLEDRETNTFTRLDEANGEYKVTLSQDVNDVGRFYLHTTAAALSVPEVHLENVSVYTTHATNIRIEGIALGKTQMKLVNMLGKEVLQQNFSSNGVSDIAIPKLARGIYIVQLNTEKGKLNKKIIID